MEDDQNGRRPKWKLGDFRNEKKESFDHKT